MLNLVENTIEGKPPIAEWDDVRLCLTDAAIALKRVVAEQLARDLMDPDGIIFADEILEELDSSMPGQSADLKIRVAEHAVKLLRKMLDEIEDRGLNRIIELEEAQHTLEQRDEQS